MDTVPKETCVVPVMTQWLLEIVAKVRDEKGDRLLLHLTRRQSRLTVTKATKRKVLTRQVRFGVDIKIVKTRRVSVALSWVSILLV